jgi:hypothetical protein
MEDMTAAMNVMKADDGAKLYIISSSLKMTIKYFAGKLYMCFRGTKQTGRREYINLDREEWLTLVVLKSCIDSALQGVTTTPTSTRQPPSDRWRKATTLLSRLLPKQQKSSDVHVTKDPVSPNPGSSGLHITLYKWFVEAEGVVVEQATEWEFSQELVLERLR